MSNPSVTSSVFTAGILISPGIELIAYKNGSFINIQLSPTIPFVCASHVNPYDCHLSVEIVQPDDQHTKIALSRCHLSVINLGNSYSDTRPNNNHNYLLFLYLAECLIILYAFIEVKKL